MDVLAGRVGTGFRYCNFSCYSPRCAYQEESQQQQSFRLRPNHRAEDLFDSRPQGHDRC